MKEYIKPTICIVRIGECDVPLCAGSLPDPDDQKKKYIYWDEELEDEFA